MQDLQNWSIYHKYELDFSSHFCRQGHCNVNAVEHKDGFVPLAVAISEKNFQLVDILVKHGADVNLPTHLGNTSLQIALNVCHSDTPRHNMKEEPYMAEVWYKVRIYNRGMKQTESIFFFFFFFGCWNKVFIQIK